MGQLSPTLRDVDWGGRPAIAFWCPGCDQSHLVTTDRWQWNGSVDRPTVQPSILVTYNGRDAGTDGAPPAVCHSFLTDGQMQFLADCSHALAGQTVALPAWPDGCTDFD
jgi:hypothetical protein